MKVTLNFQDIDNAYASGNFSAAVNCAHNFLQKALYFYLAEALIYLNCYPKLIRTCAKNNHPDVVRHLKYFEGADYYSRKIHMDNASLKNFEITEAFAIGLISETEYAEIKNVKDFRDKRSAHNLYFDKMVSVGQIPRTEIREIIDLAKDLITKINLRKVRIAKESLTETVDNFGKDINEVLNKHTVDKLLQIIARED